MQIINQPQGLACCLEEEFQVSGLAAQPSLLNCLQSKWTNAAIENGLRHLKHALHEEANRAASPQILAAAQWWHSDLAVRLRDFGADPDAVLGELRAYGALATAGFGIEPIRTKKSTATADFHLTARDGTRIVVDVATKAWDSVERTTFEAFNAEPVPHARTATIREHEITPFGKPKIDQNTGKQKVGDSITANVIQRLCGIKANEKQFAKDATNLLVLDLARGGALPLMDVGSTRPLRSWNDYLTNGELFAAFYGRKGMPVYDSRPLTYGSGGVAPMGHDGRFRQESKLSGVLLIFQKHSALLENPWAANALSETARRQFLECFGASLEHFWACFLGPKKLDHRIDLGIDLLQHFTDIDEA